MIFIPVFSLSNSHSLVFTYLHSFIPVYGVTTDGSLHDQARSFEEQLSHYSWYDPILTLIKNLYDRAPEYRENGMKPSVTSCGHMLHYRCMQSLLESSNPNLRRSNSVFCPVCRRLERGIIPALARLLVNGVISVFSKSVGQNSVRIKVNSRNV